MDPASIRHLLLGAHYRSEINLTRDGLDASGRAVRRLLDFRERLERTPSSEEGTAAGLAEAARKGLSAFRDALDEDLNTPEALAALFVMVGEVNAALDRIRGPVLTQDLMEVQTCLASMDQVLGLLELASRGRVVDDDFREWVEGLLEERRKARQSRDFARADAIRVELTAAGVVVEDSPEGSRWKRIQG